jgi:prepilin-type N-terminal cleavage/methylation domain-containing protein
MRRRRKSERGFTLIELLMVVVIIGLGVGVVMLGLGATAQARLRSSCWSLASAARYAYARAVTQGSTVRLVMDFEKNQYWMEETYGRVVLNPFDESGSGMRREDAEYYGDAGVENATLSTKMDAVGRDVGAIGEGMGGGVLSGGGGGALGMLGMMGSAGGDEGDPFGGLASDITSGAPLGDPFLAAMQQGGTLMGGGSPAGYRGARFGKLEGRSGEVRELEGETRFAWAHTPHEPEPREEGRAYVYFFPGGITEHSVIQLGDGADRIYSIEIHPLNGRAVVYPYEYEPEYELEELQEGEQ